MGERIDRFAVQPCVEMDVGSSKWEGHQCVEATVARNRDRLTALQDLTDGHETSRQMGTVRHQPITMIDEDLEASPVEFTHDVGHDPRRRRAYGRPHRNREVRTIVTIVCELAPAEVFDLGLFDRPPILYRCLAVIEEVGDNRLALDHRAASP